MTFLFGNLTFLVENDLGSGKNVGFGKEDGTVIERSKLDFFGVSSPILLFFIERQTFIIFMFLTDKPFSWKRKLFSVFQFFSSEIL